MESPEGEVKEVEATAAKLTPLMVGGLASGSRAGGEPTVQKPAALARGGKVAWQTSTS